LVDLQHRGNFLRLPLSSDQYDFYPLFPSGNGATLIKISPATLGNELSKNFQGQIYPDVPFAPPLGPPKPDSRLLLILKECWRKHYIYKEQSPILASSQYCFRSLPIAFGYSKDGIIYDLIAKQITGKLWTYHLIRSAFDPSSTV
jgi:hypothetical protein